jgi:hypothetical protein
MDPELIEDEDTATLPDDESESNEVDTESGAADESGAAEGAANDGGSDAGDEGGEGESAPEITLDGQPLEAPQSAPQWVKDLRRRNRELERELAAARQSGAQQTQQTRAPDPGPKPKAEQFDFDVERFEQALDSWHEKKRAHDAEQAQARAQAEAADREWKERVTAYQQQGRELKLPDFDEVTEAAQAVLNVTQAGLIVQGADSPALVMYALGRNPAKARELAAITDPVRFAFAVAKLESALKINPTKKPAVTPDRRVNGGGGAAGAASAASPKHLETLRAQAEQTGDYTAYLAAKRRVREAQLRRAA